MFCIEDNRRSTGRRIFILILRQNKKGALKKKKRIVSSFASLYFKIKTNGFCKKGWPFAGLFVF